MFIIPVNENLDIMVDQLYYDIDISFAVSRSQPYQTLDESLCKSKLSF
jgi:hypothetical protein